MGISRKLATLCVLLALLLAGAPSVFADTTTVKNGTQTFADVLPCAAPGDYVITLTFNAVEHTSTAANGSEHHTVKMTGTLTAVPVSGIGPSYTGHFTTGNSDNGNANSATFTVAFTIHAVGSDGSRLTFHDTVHSTINTSGLIVIFDKPRCA